MPGVINTTQTFADGDQVTSTKLTNITAGSSFTADAITGNTLAVDTGKLKVNSIGSSQLATGAVTTTALADLNVTEGKLAAGAVTVNKISDGQVTEAKLGAGAVTGAKLSGAQTGVAPVFGARAWVRFNGNKNAAGSVDSGNTARQLLGSGNVASVTKTQTGYYTVAFTTALPSANYVAVGMRAYESGDAQPVIIQGDSTTPQTASEFKFYAAGTITFGPANSSDIQLVFFG
jgi:hypothetical protein